MMFFMIIFLRLKENLGEIERLEYIEYDQITNFLEKNEFSIIIYSNSDRNSREALSFVNPAISIYKEYISFAITDKNKNPEKYCKNEIMNYCIVPYKNAHPLNVGKAPDTASAFLNWVDKISHPKISMISSLTRLNEVLNGSEISIFAITDSKNDEEIPYIPENVTKNKNIYMVSQSLFLFYNLTLSSGLYVYRPIDRQLNKINDSQNFDFLYSSKWKEFNEFKNSNNQKKYLIGYTLNQNNSVLCSLQYELLGHLSDTFDDDDFGYTIVKNTDLPYFSHLFKLENVNAPYFFVTDFSNPSKLRWLINNEKKMINQTYLKNLIENIKNGKEFPYIVSEPDDSNDINGFNLASYTEISILKIVGSNFREKVYESNNDIIVLFINSSIPKYRFFLPIVNSVASLLKESSAKFYFIDITKNDLPISVPELKKVPSIILFPYEDKYNPVIYNGNNTFIDILHFVKDSSKNKINIPDFDIDTIKENLANILNMIRFGKTFNSD